MGRHQLGGQAVVAGQNSLHQGMVFGLNVPGLALDWHALQQPKFAIALGMIGQYVPKPQQPFFLASAHQGVVKAPMARLPQGGSLAVFV
jgi:hypothetical protein